MSLLDRIPWFGTDPIDDLIDALDRIRGDGDAIALLPYSDGTFYLKKAYFDKELLGGMGGYETEDEDKIVVDGEGVAARDLFGVPIVTAVDPTEHASAVDLVKALIAQKNNLGEWIRVDKRGDIVEAGEAVMNAHGIEPDGGMVQEMVDQGDVSWDTALTELSRQGKVRKIYDIAPPSNVVVDEEGNIDIEEATHIAVDQSKAADLIPKKTSTVEINTAIDKARMEEYDEEKAMKYLMYGAIAGFLMTALAGVGMYAMMQLGGTIF